MTWKSLIQMIEVSIGAVSVCINIPLDTMYIIPIYFYTNYKRSWKPIYKEKSDWYIKNLTEKEVLRRSQFEKNLKSPKFYVH